MNKLFENLLACVAIFGIASVYADSSYDKKTEYIKKERNNGYLFRVLTINNAQDAKTFNEVGVDYITSDFAGELKKNAALVIPERIAMKKDADNLLNISDNNREILKFKELNNAEWEQVFFERGTNLEPRQKGIHKDYEKRWFLDGKVGLVENKPQGLQLTSGPQIFNNAHHMVLWTKQTFKGDLKIDFKVRVTDFENRWVNIIYIQATGEASLGYDEDISKWSRDVPAMNEYFNKMNTYHISFAAYENDNKLDVTDDYVRLRRYTPKGKDGLANTDILPDYKKTGLFIPGVEYHITIVKRNQELAMQVIDTRDNKATYFAWNNNTALPITEGRIGLRLMWARSSCFRDFSVSQIK